jgi:sugar phosphate isomerase/epimerase
VNYPRIFLTVDNCFAIKRWVKPLDWMRVIKEFGVDYIEASTDNECDPLFNPLEYLEDWAEEVKTAQERTHAKVVNFYTGYQTYRTVGLAHHDKRVREKLFQEWLQPMVRMAAKLDAGLGFCLHAFPVEVLQVPEAYKHAQNTVIQILSELAVYAWEQGPVEVSVEQMYAPHHPPWTISGAKEYLKEIYSKAKKPFYITLDLGHQVGQRKFMRLSYDNIKESLKKYRLGETIENLWLGSDSTYKLFTDVANLPEAQEDEAIREIEQEMNRYPYLFAEYDDGDPYKWLEELGCYSPIMHLQQNNGTTSYHAHFIEANNRTGIIRGDNVLKAIAKSYERGGEPGMPPKCEAIYLSFEIFAGNTEMNHDVMNRFKESVSYWRKFIPKDGLKLNELI